MVGRPGDGVWTVTDESDEWGLIGTRPARSALLEAGRCDGVMRSQQSGRGHIVVKGHVIRGSRYSTTTGRLDDGDVSRPDGTGC
jgi:hypothetical protein